jgi:hypothetical protein
VEGLAVGKRLGARFTGAGTGLNVPLVHGLKKLHEIGELARRKLQVPWCFNPFPSSLQDEFHFAAVPDTGVSG